MDFPADGSAVFVPASTDFDINDHLTIALWVNPSAFPETYHVLVTHPIEGYVFRLAGQKPQFYVKKDGVLTLSRANVSVNANEWTHLAAVWDGLGDGKLRIYVNGSEVADYINQGTVSAPLDSFSTGIRLGNMGTAHYEGLMDELAIFNKALSPSEVLSLFQDGLGDGVGNACDNCPVIRNASQTDADSDGIGDVCDDYRISGDGYNYPEPGFRASLTLDISSSSLETGWFNYYYTKLRLNVLSTSITDMFATEDTVTVEGECTVNGAAGYTCKVIITEGNPDSLEIIIYNSDGSIYFESGEGALDSGDFSITLNSQSQYQLTTSVSPTGTGSIRPDCTGGCLYDAGNLVNLNAEAYAGYIFNSWTGCDSEAGNICTMTLDADKSVTGNFETCLQPVRIGATYYSSIQSAYTASSDGNTIEIQLGLITENLVFNRDISIILKGGYNCSFNAVTGFTKLNGSMTIENGTVTINNIILE